MRWRAAPQALALCAAVSLSRGADRTKHTQETMMMPNDPFPLAISGHVESEARRTWERIGRKGKRFCPSLGVSKGMMESCTLFRHRGSSLHDARALVVDTMALGCRVIARFVLAA